MAKAKEPAKTGDKASVLAALDALPQKPTKEALLADPDFAAKVRAAHQRGWSAAAIVKAIAPELKAAGYPALTGKDLEPLLTLPVAAAGAAPQPPVFKTVAPPAGLGKTG